MFKGPDLPYVVVDALNAATKATKTVLPHIHVDRSGLAANSYANIGSNWKAKARRSTEWMETASQPMKDDGGSEAEPCGAYDRLLARKNSVARRPGVTGRLTTFSRRV